LQPLSVISRGSFDARPRLYTSCHHAGLAICVEGTDHLVTDEGLGADFAQWLADNGTQIIYAQDESDRSAG
jgi:hypothetical protein